MTKNVLPAVKVLTKLATYDPTPAEIRACKISLGEEALVKLRQAMTCPFCGAVHPPHADAMLTLVEEGVAALHETALAWRAHELLRRDSAERKKKAK